jgi:hypothetical protein
MPAQLLQSEWIDFAERPEKVGLVYAFAFLLAGISVLAWCIPESICEHLDSKKRDRDPENPARATEKTRLVAK